MAETDLSGLWRFQPDPCQEGEQREYHGAGHDTRLWREVEIPCAFDDCGPGMASYEGVGWFRRTFEVKETSQSIALRFEGVNSNARVWVNGVEIGGHEGGFLPFELPFVRREGLNEVAVRVDSTRRKGEVPGLKRGWRPYGGILREVKLIEGAVVQLDHVTVKARSTGEMAAVVEVRNVGDRAELGHIELSIDGLRRILTSRKTAFQPGITAIDLAGVMEGAMAWSPERPILYDLSVRLVLSDRVVDEKRLRTGFRTVETRGEDILLNGEPVSLRGFNRHEDTVRAGMAPDPEGAYRDLVHIKSMGANFVRLCHYPHHPSTLDLCDELGLLVMTEIPLYWWEGGEEGKLERAKDQLEQMIRRDVNHASIILWSVSNETHEQVPEVVEGNAELIRRAKEMDPSRLVVHVSDHWQSGEACFKHDDVICLNAYPSWPGWNLRPDAARFWQESITKLQERYPDKPIMVTEFGYPALHGVRESAIGEEEQMKAVAIEAQAIQPLVCGMALWCYADHPWPEEDFIRYLTTSPFGAVTRDRREKLVCDVIRQLWSAPNTQHPTPNTDLYVRMVRRHMRDISQFEFPQGYGIRPMQAGDEGLWEDCQRDAEPVLSIEPGLFLQAFGDDPQAISRRVFLITDPRGLAVGTIGAWMSRDFEGQDWGRIHWVSVRRSEQGKGLMKAAMTFAMNLLASMHDRAWLDTSTSRLGAIKVYLDFGFELDMSAPYAEEAKHAISKGLNRTL